MREDAEDVKRDPLREAFSPRRLGEYLIAILGGNIIYLFIEPGLPTILRHRMFRIDLGLGVDFLICAAAYGLIRQFHGPGNHRG